MKPWRRRLVVLVVVIVVLLGGYMTSRFIGAWQSRSVPMEFSEARTRGGLISQDIVADSGQIAADLARLNNTTSNYAQASSTISGILGRVENIKKQALDLANELGNMARALSQIHSAQARAAAMESISHRLALVSSLIEYTDQVASLAWALRLNLGSNVNNSKEISLLIEEINAEVERINQLNQEANESMERFDQLVR